MIATLSKTAVTKAKEIAQNLNANAVIVEVMVGEKLQQMAVSEDAYINRPFMSGIDIVIATVDSTGTVI